MKKLDVLLLGIILVLALSLRLYKIQSPLTDISSGEQSHIASVARNFTRDGFNLMKPVYDDLSSLPTNQNNPEGLRMAEFPLYNATFGFLYRYLPIVSLEVYGRIVSIIFSLFLIGVLYYFSLKEHSRIAAVAAAGVYAIFPFFAFFSRVVLPDTMGLSLMFLSLWLLYLYLVKHNRSLFLFFASLLLYSLALLVKSSTFFYTISAVYLFLITYKFDVFKKWQPYVFLIVGVLPFILWRVYSLQFPEGIPDMTWQFRFLKSPEGLVDIFFRPVFFRTLFMDRIGSTILGVYLVGFVIIGSIGRYKSYFLHTTFLAAIVYVCTFQGGNMTYEYYQIMILPALALMMGMGIGSILEEGKTHINLYAVYPTLFIAAVFSWYFSYHVVRSYYDQKNNLPQMAKLINTFTRPEDRIVTDTNGDPTLLYLADRKGAPTKTSSIPELKKNGYQFLVTSDKQTVMSLKEAEYEFLIDNDQFSLIKL